MSVKELLDLATPEERERLMNARLDYAQRALSLWRKGKLYVGNPSAGKVAKNRAKNKAGRAQRKANQAIRKGQR